MAEPKTDTSPAPTLGRIVHYTLTEDDEKRIDNDRIASLAYGNLPHAGDTVPVVVVGGAYAADEDRMINGQAFLDGNDRLWVANVTEGDGPGQWRWPPRV